LAGLGDKNISFRLSRPQVKSARDLKFGTAAEYAAALAAHAAKKLTPELKEVRQTLVP
jgi:hypothetical protein